MTDSARNFRPVNHTPPVLVRLNFSHETRWIFLPPIFNLRNRLNFIHYCPGSPWRACLKTSCKVKEVKCDDCYIFVFSCLSLSEERIMSHWDNKQVWFVAVGQLLVPWLVSGCACFNYADDPIKTQLCSMLRPKEDDSHCNGTLNCPPGFAIRRCSYFPLLYVALGSKLISICGGNYGLVLLFLYFSKEDLQTTPGL